MNNTSWKHHYLPVFYLNSFTDETGKFKIYNVQSKRFIKNGKDFSPESYFFEENANTIFSDGKKTDLIEESYSKLETKFSKLILKIQSSNKSNKFGVSEEDMPEINYFVSFIYWRLPHKKKELEEIISKNELINLGLKVNNIDGSINKEKGKEFKNHPEFLKIYRYINSMADNHRGTNCNTPYTIIDKHQNIPNLCSDNPVIFEKEFSPRVYYDDYIFPLSGKRLFIKCDIKERIDNFLWYQIDVILFKQAIKYVSCTNEDYIEMLENSFQNYNMTLEELKIEVFKKLRK